MYDRVRLAVDPSLSLYHTVANSVLFCPTKASCKYWKSYYWRMILNLPTVLLHLLGAYLPFQWSQLEPSSSSSSSNFYPPLRFELRHSHGVANDTRILFRDHSTSLPSSNLDAQPFLLKTEPVTTYRPPSYQAFVEARQQSLLMGDSQPQLQWQEELTHGPNVSDRETLLALAKMTNNAYLEPSDDEWYDLGSKWKNRSQPFGWEPDADGFRGHVFVSTDNSTVVVSVKGTSAGWVVGGGGPTVIKDKFNDNLLFSCCCARVGPTWTPVCDCYSGSDKCDQSCVEKSLTEESLFYSVGINLYNNVTYLYPDANIWLTGHSLGGSLASLMGVTFGVPTVAFEAPPEKLAATRLHLPSPPSLQPITHVFHTADPIPMGVCNGVFSACAIGGYAFETRCHLGRLIRYDTVSKRNWGVSIRKHGIQFIIDEILSSDWEEDLPVPLVEPEEEDCVECYNWSFGDYKNTLD